MLTVGICGLIERIDSLEKIFNELSSQGAKVIAVIDNRQKSLGFKRNYLLEKVTTDIVSFVDDDDRIDKKYVETILREFTDCDLLTFRTQHYQDGSKTLPVVYSSEFRKQKNLLDRYERYPNAICVWKTDLIKKIGFSDITFGEDSEFGERVSLMKIKEKRIKDILYHHQYDTVKSLSNVRNESDEVIELSFEVDRFNANDYKHLTNHLITCYRY